MRPLGKTLSRVITRLLLALGILILLVGLFLAVAVYWVRTERGQQWLLARAIALAQPHTGTLTVDTLSTDLFTGLRVEGITLRDDAGKELLHADSFEAAYTLARILHREVRITRVAVAGLRADTRLSADGVDIATIWTDPDATPAPSTPWSGLPIDLAIEDIDVRSTALSLATDTDAFALTGATLRGAVSFVGDGIAARGVHLQAASTPDLGALLLETELAWSPRQADIHRLELRLGPQHASISGTLASLDQGDASAGIRLHAMHVETDRLPWELPVFGTFDATGEVTGLVEAPVVALRLATPGGDITLDGTLDQRPTRPTWSMTVGTNGLVVDAFVRDLDPVTVDARVVGEGTGLEWPGDLDARVSVDATAAEAGPVAHAALSTALTLSKGVVTIDRLTASASTGSVEATGRVDVVAANAALAVQRLEVQLRDLRRFDLDGLRGVARFTGDVEADWSGADPAARLEGELSAVGAAYGDTARVASLRGPVRVDWADRAGVYHGTFAARGVTAPSTRLDRAVLRADGTATQLGALRLDAEVEATGLTAGSAAIATLDANARLVRRDDGDLTGTVDFTTTELGAGPVRGERAAGALTVRGDVLAATFDLYDEERTIVGLDAAGDLSTRRFEASRLILSPDKGQTWVGEGVQTITLADDGFDDLRVAIRAESTAIDATGRFHTEGSTALNVDLVDFPLSLLEAFKPELHGYQGVLGATASAAGTGEDLAVRADATVKGLGVPGAVHDLDAVVRTEGAAGRLTVDARVEHRQRVLATLVGSLPVSLALKNPGVRADQPIDLVLEVPAFASGEVNAVLDAASLPEMRGSGNLKVAGTPLRPELTLTASVEKAPAEKGEPWLGTRATVTASGDALSVDAVLLEGRQARGTLKGGAAIPLERVMASILGAGPDVDLADPSNWGTQLDFVFAPDIPLQSLSTLAEVPEGVQGRLVGEVQLTGSTRAPVVDGKLEVKEARLNDLAVSPATVSIAPRGEGYAVKVDLGFGAEGGVKVAAYAPFAYRLGEDLAAQLARPGLKVEVTGEGIPLEAVSAVWPEMQEASGQVRMSGSLEGAISAPAGDLEMSGKELAFRLLTTGVAYDQVGFVLRAGPSSIRLERVHARTTSPSEDPDRGIQGTVDATLEALIEGNTIASWRGRVDFDRTLLSAVSDRYLRLASGRIELDGSPDDAQVTGSLTVEESRLHLDDRFFDGPGSTRLPAWLTVHRPSTRPRAEAPIPEDEGLPDWLGMKMRLDLGRNTFLRAQIPLGGSVASLLGPFASIRLDTQADGALQVGARDGDLSITGEVVPLRGTTVLFGKSFEISDGSTISFTGRDYAAPVLEVHAAYDTRTYGVVEATITGVPDALKVTLTSTQYPSQDDIIALLLVGKPASEMSAGEGAGEGASAAAMSMLLTTVGQTLGREGEKVAAMVIAPDLLVVGDQTARVGKRIGKRVFVVVDIDNTADDRTSSYLVFTVEAAIGRAWEAEFRHGTAGEDAVEVHWTHRY